MSDLVIGQLTLKGTDAQNAILAPMAETMAAVLLLPDGTSRIKPANVIVRKRSEMPWARKPDAAGKGGIRARGFWTGRNQLLADDLFPTPDLCRKTFAHETVHQLDDQWLLNSNRRAIKPLFEPDAAGWPAEPYAVYASAALFGFTKPPYTKFYPDFVVPVSEWPKLKEFSLRDDRPVPPVDPDDEIIARLVAELAAANELLVDLQTGNQEIAAQSLELANKAQGGTSGGVQ